MKAIAKRIFSIIIVIVVSFIEWGMWRFYLYDFERLNLSRGSGIFFLGCWTMLSILFPAIATIIILAIYTPITKMHNKHKHSK